MQDQVDLDGQDVVQDQVDLDGQDVVQPSSTGGDDLMDGGSVENDDILRGVSTLTKIYYANEVAGMIGNKIFCRLNVG